MRLGHLLAGLTDACRRNAWWVLLAALVLGMLSAVAADLRLGIDTNTDDLFLSTLPWRQRAIEFNKEFPQFQDLIVAVVDASIPEEAEVTQRQLAQALAADKEHFRSVSMPDASPYLERNGLLFLDAKRLGDVLNRVIDAQPFLGQLVADPSARGLFSALSLVAIGASQPDTDLTSFYPALRSFHQALAAAAAGHPQPLSWEDLLAGDLVNQAGPYRFVLAQPVLNHGVLEPGGAATAALRADAAKIEFVRDGSAHVRVTGQVPLADEEFATVARGAVGGTVASAVLITLWLLLAVRSWRLIVPIVWTLVVGLLLTTGFAALAVGRLNLVSLAFAILFVGIAVDFAIQFSVRYREMRLEVGAPATALVATAMIAGPQILTAAASSSAGFFAFVPTAFSGVAELGLIAGVGMLIAFACTLTVLPAALSVSRPHGEGAPIGFHQGEMLENWLVRFRVPVLAISGAIAVLGAVLVPHLTFDSNPLDTKDPNTEAMLTLRNLMNSPITNPYTVDILTPSLAAADATAAKLNALPLVANALTLSSFVPRDQQAKLPLIADATNVLEATLAPQPPAAPVTPADLRLAAQTALAQIDHAASHLKKDDPLLAVGGDLRALQSAPDALLMATNSALTRFLPMMLDRLRLVLSAEPVDVSSIPPDVARNWQLPDGRVRVQAVPKPEVKGSSGLQAFVVQVRTVAPDAGGSAVTIVETARTIIGAFRQAVISAILAIAVILALMLRRALDVGLVLAPLLLSALMTAAIIVLLPLPLNFANIIALPLLLGVGVSFNIYFVMNWRNGKQQFVGTATARAIVFSALTTSTAFGSLALNPHPGTASMGELLLISLGSTLAVTMLFMPTMLRSVKPPA